MNYGRAHAPRALVLFLPLLASLPPAFAQPPPSPTTPASPTAEPSNVKARPTTCRSLSLNAPSGASGEQKALYEVIADFEKAFETNDPKIFRTIVHPALSRERDKPDVFTGTVHDFGLEKARLVRNALFETSFPQEQAARTVECKGGELRGVVGPERQYAAVHSYSGGNEQIKLFTLYAPVQEGLKSRQGNTKRDLGLVMLFAQVWTHGKQSPEVLLAEGRKWSVLDEPIAAWILAEAGLRILSANPYFSTPDSAEAERLATAARAKLPSFDPFREKVTGSGTGWRFEDLAVIFQQDGVEVGAKFRMKGEESVNAQITKCKTLGVLLGNEFPGLTKRFKGFECMPYGEKEGLENPPEAGTQFHAWRDLAKPVKN